MDSLIIIVILAFVAFGFFIKSHLASVTSTLEKNISETLSPFGEKLAALDATGQTMLRLTDKVEDFGNIFSDKSGRGSFGELGLETMVKEQFAPQHYAFQKTLSNGARPDCILYLQDPIGKLIIDSKFPLEDYRAFINAKSDADRNHALKNFQAQFDKHTKDIATKYIIEGETADKAIMFVPSEAVFSFIHEQCGGHVQKGRRRNVFVVSPATLWAVLNTIRAVLRDIELRDNIKALGTLIAGLGDDAKRIHERAEKLAKHFDAVGQDLKGIQTSAGKIQSGSQKFDQLQIQDLSKQS